jgi:hypothetical protein
MHKLGRWFRDNSLWIVSLGLMLASSGIDGAYMAKWMPPGFGWLGLVLNTMSDVSGMVIIYWFGRLQQDRSSRKRRLSSVLLAAEAITVLYSWLFSWRQLRLVLPATERVGWQWVSAVAAGFIPLLLAFIGYAEALLAGRVEDPKPREAQTATAQIASEVAALSSRPRATIDDWRALLPDLNGETAELSASDVEEIVHQAGFDPPSTRTCSHWARSARQKGE